MEKFEDCCVVEREEVMVSPRGGGYPTLRSAHFLQPTVTSFDGPVFEIPSHCISSLPPSFEPKNWPLEVRYNGWRNPQREWKTWVEKMSTLHESTWKKSGIREAIWSSTYKILRSDDLVLGLAEKWCPETKSFIFSWGEATITLEDVLVSGYSVLGSPVFGGLETEELMEIEKKLNQARTALNRSASKKPGHWAWLKKFMNRGSDIEHEAFLALWLSRFVFPGSFDVIIQAAFPIAIQLSRGTRIALAPAILASIYRDLGLLKEKIVSLAGLENCGDKEDVLQVTVCSPFQLVQIWAWERFIEFRPRTNMIRNGEPRCAQWNKTIVAVKNVRTVLDYAGVIFDWRPYAKCLFNWKLPKFYAEEEMWVPVDINLHEEFESLHLCLRASELVGLDCVEQYLPHRVAMQFGIDQDLPAWVAQANATPRAAWTCYIKPITCKKLYVPPRLYEAEVTTRYSKWWKQSFLHLKQENEVILPPTRTSLNFELAPTGSKAAKVSSSVGSKMTLKTGKNKNEGDSFSTFKIQPNRLTTTADREGSSERLDGMKEGVGIPFCSNSSMKCPELSQKTKDLNSSPTPGFLLNKAKTSEETSKGKEHVCNVFTSAGLPLKELSSILTIKKQNDYPAPPGFAPKFNLVETRSLVDEDNMTIAEILRSSNVPVINGERLSSHSQNVSSMAKNEAAKTTKPPTVLIENIMQNERVNDKTEIVMEDASDHKSGNPEKIQGSESRGTELPDFQFEERVSRVRMIFAELLKDARLNPSNYNKNILIKHHK